jgi:hypothetical protein
MHISSEESHQVNHHSTLEWIKHIGVNYDWTREIVSLKLLKLDKIHADMNGLDIMIKILPSEKLLVYCKAKDMSATPSWVVWGRFVGILFMLAIRRWPVLKLFRWPKHCKIPLLINVMTKDHIGQCTWQKGEDKPPIQHTVGVRVNLKFWVGYFGFMEYRVSKNETQNSR